MTHELVTKTLPLVSRLSWTLASRWRSDQRELYSAGSLALCEAARRFDPSRSDSWAAYTEKTVRGAMRDAVYAARGRTRYAVRKWATLNAEGRPTASYSPPLHLDAELVRTLRAEELDIVEDLHLQRLGSRLELLLGGLEARRRTILEQMLAGRTLTEIAAELGVSETRIRQLSMEAIQTLQTREEWLARHREDARQRKLKRNMEDPVWVEKQGDQ